MCLCVSSQEIFYFSKKFPRFLVLLLSDDDKQINFRLHRTNCLTNKFQKCIYHPNGKQKNNKKKQSQQRILCKCFFFILNKLVYAQLMSCFCKYKIFLMLRVKTYTNWLKCLCFFLAKQNKNSSLFVHCTFNIFLANVCLEFGRNNRLKKLTINLYTFLYIPTKSTESKHISSYFSFHSIPLAIMMANYIMFALQHFSSIATWLTLLVGNKNWF